MEGAQLGKWVEGSYRPVMELEYMGMCCPRVGLLAGREDRRNVIAWQSDQACPSGTAG